MSKKKKRGKKADKVVDIKPKGKQPTDQWRRILRGTRQNLFSGWIQNFVVGLVILLLGPAIGIMFKNPKYAIFGLALGLTAIIWIVAAIAVRQASDDHVQETETYGLLIPANDPDPPNPCPNIPPDAMKIFLGTSACWTTAVSHTVLQIANEDIISLRRTDNGLAVSSRVFSADGRIVAQLIDNEFHINPNNYFRRERPDRHTLLVYDQQTRLVLRVRYLNHLAVKLSGIFNYPNRRPVIIEEDRVNVGGNTIMRMCLGNNRVSINVQ